MTGPGVQDPTTVGPYRLVQRLGEGGMGVVHLALDPSGRAVALKLLRAHVAADPQARLRMVREVETLRRVRHARVAEVLDADVAGQVPYLVTRFVPGRTLDEYVRENGPLPVEQVADLGRGLAAALQAIHTAGVVHRDIKPANVMLLDGQPVLIDFGIAHLTDESRITVTGLVMGTPGYLSPEVVDGQPVSSATDWWGWAATLAFAASGRPPFGAGPLEAVLDRVRRGAADLGGVDAALRPVLAGALAADPARRSGPGLLLAGLAEAVPAAPGLTAAREAAASEQTLRQRLPASVPDGSVVNGSGLNGSGLNGSVVNGSVVNGSVVNGSVVNGSGRNGWAFAGPGPDATVSPASALPGTVHRPVPTRPYPSPAPAASLPSAPSLPPVPSLPPSAPGPYGAVGGPVPGRYPPPVAPPAVDGPAGGEVAPGAWQPPSQGVGPVRPTGTLLGVLAALTATAAVAPVGALLVAASLMVVARTVDRTSTAMWRRRQDAGRRAADVAVAVFSLPWRLVQALVATLFALVLPMLVGVSVAFIAGAGGAGAGLGGQSGSPVGTPTAPGALAAAAVATLLMAWWGPGGGSLRRGGRAVARVAVRNAGARITVWVLLLLVVASALIVLGQHPQPVVLPWRSR
jgi:serine/threonine protein kinase